jgi:hypothetical protein
MVGKGVEQVGDGEILECAAEEHGRQMALAEREEVETAADIADQRDREIDGSYNLWRGYGFEARQGDCQRYLGR